MNEQFKTDYLSMKLVDFLKKYGISKQHLYNLLKRGGIQLKGRSNNGRTKERREIEKNNKKVEK